MSNFQELGELAARHQDPRLESVVDMSVARRRLLDAPVGRSRSLRPRMFVLAAAAVAACALAFVVARDRAPAPLTFRVGEANRIGEVDAWLEAPAEGSLPLRFSDGTAVVLKPSARVRVTRLGSDGATVRVEAGRADVSVKKRARAAWQLSLGPFQVDVTGTRFDIDWDPDNDRLLLAMREGSVLVSGCVFGTGRSFRGGETVRASCREGHVEISTLPPASAAAAGSMALSPTVAPPAPGESGSAVIAEPRAIPSSASGAGPGPNWRELARRGEHRQAFDAAESAGFSAECAAGSASDLVALGDAARYIGRLERAVEAYETVRRRFPNHERAAVAAFALGRVAFDQRGAFADAARWFRTYLAEQPNGRLARDALGRLMESLDRAGDAAGARTEAKRYLERHPAGPHAEMARRLVLD